MQTLTLLACVACLTLSSTPSLAINLTGEKATQSQIYQPTKTAVMKTLDKLGVNYWVDRDGDLMYTMNTKGWRGYIIFSYTAAPDGLWSVQVRTQFATKVSYYEDLVEYANHWNATQKMPKIAMKTRSKMVLSFNYPVQYGFNPDEFEHNVLRMFNRKAGEIGTEINSMRR